MTSKHELTLNVAEVLHYCSNLEASVEFYSGKLGWAVVWQAPDYVAVIDAGGAYQLSLVSAKLIPGWEDGKSVPIPQVAFESTNLNEDVALLSSAGIKDLKISGDPASMLSTNLIDPEGIEIFVWQEASGTPVNTAVKDYKKGDKADALYSLGECILFIDNIKSQEEFYISKLGFTVNGRDGDVFTSMSRNDGPVLGLFVWSKWWDKPSEPKPDLPARLFLECPDINKERERQVSAGISPGELKTHPMGLFWFTIADPDNNLITFWQFVPPKK